ncbi:class I SAM-dependent methyltransferase [Woodsholea maritima]|uniref:class I SAM-dependent methyltransferase n=1 Tax=Woodsholea maritima TaxID=240237 RepID=UPI000371B253|nr:class I SAM-dependent methyltransferase [Woodsholea maritima]
MSETQTHDQTRTASFGFKQVDWSQKAGMVKGVFDSAAPKYDLMNDLMSFGVHRVWKDMMITKLNPQPGEHLIDVAGGTGDIARAFLDRADAVQRRRGGQPASAIVADINYEMLQAGRKRGLRDHMDWACVNAECLPFEAASAHAVTISFGIRNVTDRAAALSEFHRVLKPGGRFFCLEFSRPTTRALEKMYDLWSFNAIPQMGEWIVKDRESYQYLVESIRRFPIQSAFAAEIEAAGFKNVKVTNFSGGIAALHTGWKI